MHFVMGGAFNGKSDWVKKHYKLPTNKQYINCRQLTGLEIDYQDDAELIVLEEVHECVKVWLESNDADKARALGRAWLKENLAWENEKKNRQIVLIGTDFSKGIVPMSQSLRLWRDVTGWFYQDIVEASEEVYQIWYGLSRKLK